MGKSGRCACKSSFGRAGIRAYKYIQYVDAPIPHLVLLSLCTNLLNFRSVLEAINPKSEALNPSCKLGPMLNRALHLLHPGS